MTRKRQVERLLQRAAADVQTLAVFLYGSVARGEAAGESDIDVCVVLTPGRYTPQQLSEKRLEYLQDGELDG